MCVSGLKNCIKGMLTAPTMWPLGISGGRGKRRGNCQYKDGVDIVLIIKAISSGMNRTTTKAPYLGNTAEWTITRVGLWSGSVESPSCAVIDYLQGLGDTELVSITHSK